MEVRMKKFIVFIILFIVSIILSIPGVSALENTDIHSNEALLVNMNTGEVLFHKNTKEEAVPIASLTKIMTYAVVLDEIPDLENTKIVVPEGLVQEMIQKGASRADLIEGYEYSALDLLYGVMLPSGCDAAEVLARYIGGGDSSVFVEKMNEKALSLGMTHTHYLDSYGIGTVDEENVSTEEDLYLLMKYVYSLPHFKEIISTEYHNIIGVKGEDVDTDSVRNTNYLIGEYSGGEYYNPYSIGGKTGNLMVAGRCLITIAQKGDFEVLAITLGVPNEAGSAYDYHLVDHNKLFEYAFSSYTENITIDIGPLYRSVEKDKKIKIDATTSKDTILTWTSSNIEVASVDSNGVVTGISQGQAKIVATTETGNLAYTYVSVDFYNGVHTKYSTGPENDQNGWDPIDYSIIKDKGFDYVMIRAGYGGTTMDKTFLENIRNAIDNGLNVGIWYEGYADDKEEAIVEANHLISILKEIQDIKEKVNLPVLYNLLYSGCSDPEILYEMISSFQEIIKQEGYDVMLELGKTKLSTMELQKLDELGVPVSIIYRSILPNYQETMKANDKEADIWNYKANAYLEKGLGQNASFSLLYMRFKKLITMHKEYVEEVLEDSSLEETASNTVSTSYLNHTLNSVKNTFEKKDIQITVGTPTILKNSVKREKSNPIHDIEDKNINYFSFLLPIFLLIIGFIIGFLYLKKSNES